MTNLAYLKRGLLAVCALSFVLGVSACSDTSHDPGITGQPTQDTNSAAVAARGNQKVGVVPGSGPAGSQ